METKQEKRSLHFSQVTLEILFGFQGSRTEASSLYFFLLAQGVRERNQNDLVSIW